jgi:hypothetical protein
MFASCDLCDANMASTARYNDAHSMHVRLENMFPLCKLLNSNIAFHPDGEGLLVGI